MKTILFFMFAFTFEHSWSGDFKIPTGMKKNSIRAATAPDSVDFGCRLELHEYLNGWKLILDREFYGRVGETTNYTKLGLEIRGAAYEFIFVYNLMGSMAFANDPFDGENSSIHLYRKINTAAAPLIEASVSSRKFQELPQHFDLREDFKAEGSQFILRTSCRTDKNF